MHRCPFAAHIRKVNPRDILPKTVNSRMVRNGIPYGTEFSEDKDGKRGMLFACYQSSIDNSFQFVQKTWSNEPHFPQTASELGTGYDPIIGQAPRDEHLHMAMYDPDDKEIEPGFGKFPKLVTLRGGEYFFVPSLSALTNVLGTA